jgi:hypothetical protein
MRVTSLILVVGACIVGTLLARQQKLVSQDAPLLSPHDGSPVLADSLPPRPAEPSTAVHTVLIRKPSGPPKVKLAQADPQQRPAEVACSTCHSIRTPNYDNRSSAALDEFHQGLEFSHGQLACYACHNPTNADTLRLADGSTLEFTEVMSLCSQCHSKQAESFAHGAHGGMTGFWDLTRGPQTKNACIDCHDPHSPKYPQMIVTFKPKDRFNPSEDSHAHPE